MFALFITDCFMESLMLHSSFCSFKRFVDFLFFVQLLYFYCLAYTKWSADGFKALADLSCSEQRGPGHPGTGCVGGKPEARQEPVQWSTWGQHWSHLAELMPAHVCHGTAASMLRAPLEGSPFALWNSWWSLLFTTQPCNALSPSDLSLLMVKATWWKNSKLAIKFTLYTVYNQA